MPQTIESRFNSGRSSCHPVQRRLSNPLLPKNIKVRLLPAVFFNGFESWFFILRAQNRRRMFEKTFDTARETAVGRRVEGTA